MHQEVYEDTEQGISPELLTPGSKVLGWNGSWIYCPSGVSICRGREWKREAASFPF